MAYSAFTLKDYFLKTPIAELTTLWKRENNAKEPMAIEKSENTE